MKAALGLVALLLAAGCVTSGSRVDPASVAPVHNAIVDALHPRPADDVGASTDWWVMGLRGSPEGGLAGARWVVPPGASIMPSMTGMMSMASPNTTVVSLELSPIAPRGKEAALEAWGVVFFKLDENGTFATVIAYDEIPTTETTYVAGIGAPSAHAAHIGPAFLHLVKIPAGTTIGVVAFARTNEPMDVALAFRTLATDPPADATATSDPAAFVAARSTQPISLSTRAGRGLSIDAYSLIRSDGFPAGAPIASESRAGHVVVDAGPAAATVPLGGPWVGSIAIDPGFKHGWTQAAALYLDAGEGTSTWNASLNVHGKKVERSGVSAAVGPGLLAGQRVLGSVVAGTRTDGDGTSTIRLSVNAPGRPGLVQSFQVTRIEFGATLTELLGAPAKEFVVLTSLSLPVPSPSFPAALREWVRVDPFADLGSP